MDSNTKLVGGVVVWNRHQELCTAPALWDFLLFFSSTPNEQTRSPILYANNAQTNAIVVKDQRIGIRVHCCSNSSLASRQHLQPHVQRSFSRQEAAFECTMKIGCSRWSCNIDPCSFTNQWPTATWSRRWGWGWYQRWSSAVQVSWIHSSSLLIVSRKALQVQRWLSCKGFKSALADVYRYVLIQH